MHHSSIENALANGAQFRCGPIGIRRSRGDKLLFYCDGPSRSHLTAYWRRDTGEFDMHLTDRGPGGWEEHTPILRISPDGLTRALSEITRPAIKIMLGAIRNLEPDFLERRRIVVVAGLYPQGAALEELCAWRDPKTLELDEFELGHRIRVLGDPIEIFDAPDGLYDLREGHDWRWRSIGVAIKGKHAAGRTHVVWIKWNRWAEAVKKLEALYLLAFTRHASALGAMWPAQVNNSLS
jgi:hypothetical protein